jgi:hypothetical protein
MAGSGWNNVTSLDHGILLDIVFTKGVRDQISQDYAEFNLLQGIRNKEATPRALTYKVMTHRGPARVQYMNPGSATENMPVGQKVGIAEYTAYFKEIASTVIVDSNLLQRLKATSAKAADELALEMDASVFNIRRQLCCDLYADGTGLVVRAKSVVVTTGAANTAKVTVTAANMGETVDSLAVGGSITFLQEGDLLLGATKAGVAIDLSGDTSGIVAWKVSAIDVEAGTFVLTPVNSAGAALALVANTTGEQADGSFVAGTCLYRQGQTVFPDLTGAIADYALASKSIVGLESLGASDGRVCNGFTMSGIFAGTRVSANSALLDTSVFQKAFSKAKRRVGQSAMSWNSALMSELAYDVMVQSKEADRRFVAVDDNSRGSRTFKFIHNKDSIEFIVSEFCPVNRIWSLPSSAKSGKAVEFHSTDFISQKSPDNSSPWNRVPGSVSGTFTKQFVAYESAHMQMVATQPAGIISIVDFVLA